MKRASTYLLATFTAVALAACGPKRADTNATGGAETGATGSAYDTTSTSTTPTMSDTGMKSDAGMKGTSGVRKDSSKAPADSTAH